MMKIVFGAGDVAKLTTPLCALACREESFLSDEHFKKFDSALAGLLKKVVDEERFTGKSGQSLVLHCHGRIGPDRLLLIGAGKPKPEAKPDLSEWRDFAAKAVKCAQSASLTGVALVVPADEKAVGFATLGALLTGYKFDRYWTGEKKKKVAVDEFCLATSQSDAVTSAAARAEKIARGVTQARDLVNEPAAEMTPRKMAEVAEKLAKTFGLEAKILGPADCKKLGMGMYLGVAQGSDEEPRLIHLTYRPEAKPQKRIALIGKGVTFDSGGLSLKPSNAMEDMKIDMAGAAAVLSAISVLAELRVPYEVHAIAACTENMPSGRSYKLGDVLRSMNGKTVEVNNTDAEGRLTLGDAITYALSEIRPDELFDFATLTGACMVALGPYTAGVMGTSDALTARWLEAAKRAGEDMWQLPLNEKLRDQLKSEVADMRNTGDRYGGALTAGLFLKEFTGETPWVHVDLAGPAAADKDAGYIAKGGTGFGVATIVEYLS